jgi:hypothetical protein
MKTLGFILSGDAIDEYNEKGKLRVDDTFLVRMNFRHEDVKCTVPHRCSLKYGPHSFRSAFLCIASSRRLFSAATVDLLPKNGRPIYVTSDFLKKSSLGKIGCTS